VTEDVAPQAADLGQGLDKSSAADGSTCCLTVRLVAQANLAAVADIASIVLIIDGACDGQFSVCFCSTTGV
jgi:hypothetical protein